MTQEPVREIPLHGGNVSTVSRIGDTVRRNAGPWTPAVHALLNHLERVGFTGSPRAFGMDAAPTEREMAPLGEPFAPYRSVLAWWYWREVDTDSRFTT